MNRPIVARCHNVCVSLRYPVQDDKRQRASRRPQRMPRSVFFLFVCEPFFAGFKYIDASTPGGEVEFRCGLSDGHFDETGEYHTGVLFLQCQYAVIYFEEHLAFGRAHISQVIAAHYIGEYDACTCRGNPKARSGHIDDAVEDFGHTDMVARFYVAEVSSEQLACALVRVVRLRAEVLHLELRIENFELRIGGPSFHSGHDVHCGVIQR